MDISSQRPAVGSSSTVRPETVQYREAVRTEMKGSRPVAAAAGGDDTARTDDRRTGDATATLDRQHLARLQRVADALREGLEKRVEDDQASETLVFRTVDTKTGRVVRQFPDDMILKLRAYAREMERREEEAGGPTMPEHRIERIA